MKFLSSNGLRKLIELVKNAFIKKEDVVETETIDLIETEAVTLDPIATDGIPDLDTIRSNASTGAGLAPQVEVNTQRIEELTIAKFPNVVIVGTPHIEGGQVSNYSDTSYLQFPFVDISRGQPFDIYFSFTTTQDITTQQNILDAHFGIALAVQNGRGVMALSSNGTSWDIGTTTGTNTLLPNTTYYVKYSWTGTQYNASLSTDDQEYVPDMTINSTLSPYKTTIFIGGSPNIFGAGSAHPFKGTINFNKSKVVVNGITVWEGMADVGLASRANVSLNNLDEVGEARFTDIQTAIDGKQPIGNYALKSELPTLARANVPGLVAGGNWLTVNQTTGKMECGELTKAQFDSALGYTFISKTTLNNVLTPKLNEKQDTLTAGDNITIENNVISSAGGSVTPDNMVTTDTAQTISDLKNFSNDGRSSDSAQIELTATNIDASSAPADNKYAGLLIKDTNGKRVGKLETVQLSDGSLRTILDATNLDGRHGQIAVQIATDGTVSTIAPTPATSDNSTKIATTAWVKTNAQPAASYGSSAGMTWGSVYTCPANGYVRIGAKARDNSYAYLRLNSTSGSILWQHGDYGGASFRYGVVPVAKGTKVVAHGGASDQVATFYYGM